MGSWCLGYLSIPGQSGLGGSRTDRLGTAAGWERQVTESNSRTVCHCCQPQGAELSSWHSLRPLLSLWEQRLNSSPINHRAPTISHCVTMCGGRSSVPPLCRCSCPQEGREAQEQGPPQESQTGALFWLGSHDVPVHLHQTHEHCCTPL